MFGAMRLIPVIALATVMIALTPTAAMAAVSPQGTPIVDGSVSVGSVLTCDTSLITWISDDGGTPTPVDFQFYYWDSADQTVGSQIEDTGSGTADTYVVQEQDQGQQIVCEEVVQDAGGDGSQTTSDPSSPTTAVPPGPTAAGAPVVTGPAEVGQNLNCNTSAVDWSPEDPGDTLNETYQWVYESNGKPADNGGSDTSQTYVPDANDVGQQLVCIDTATDTGTGDSTSIWSIPTPVVVSEPSVTLTQFSPVVTGSFPVSLSNLQVVVTLSRFTAGSGYAPVAIGTFAGGLAVNTLPTQLQLGATGEQPWKLALKPLPGYGPVAFGAPGDQLTITYSSNSPKDPFKPITQTFTLGQNVFFEDESSVSADGFTVSSDDIPGANCSELQYIVDGTTDSTTPTRTGACVYTNGVALTDADTVEAAFTQQDVGDSLGDAADITTIDDVGLPGVPASASNTVGNQPTCSADLVYGTITCDELNSNSFYVDINDPSGNPIATAVNLSTSENGDGSYTGTATVPGALGPGDTVELFDGDDNGPLTTLTLATLRIDAGNNTGSCAEQLLHSAGRRMLGGRGDQRCGREHPLPERAL